MLLPLAIPRKKLGSYGLLGGEITVEGAWVPDPEVEAGVMMEIAGYLENTVLPLASSAVIARHDTEERFKTETDPDGTEWAPLDDEYLLSKITHGYPEDILHREGPLEKAAPTGWKVIGDTLIYDPSVLPEYGLKHQTGKGAENVGGAAIFRVQQKFKRSKAGIEAGLGDMEGSGHDSLGIGRGNALPARPFIGLSDEAVGEIAEVFDLWFGRVNEIFIHPATGAAQHRIPKDQPGAGQFGKGI